MNVLLTGATGFLGSRVVRELLARGHRVSALRRETSNPWRLEQAANAITWHSFDDRGIGEALRTNLIDAVVHMATTYGRHGERVSEIVQTNLALPIRLVEQAVASQVGVFVTTGTSLSPDVSEYALSKYQFGVWAQRMTSGTSTRFVDAAIELMFGPMDDDWKLVPMLVRRCLEGDGPIDLTPGEQRRDLVYVDDVARAICLLAEDSRAQGRLEVGTGQAISVRELALRVRDRSHSDAVLRFGALDYRPNEMMTYAADVRAMRSLGWTPQVTLDDGLDRTITWYRERQSIAGGVH